MRLNIALVDHGSVKLTLNDHLGGGKARGQVAARELDMVGDIRIRGLPIIALAQTGDQDRSLIIHGLNHVLHVRQDFIVNLNQLRGFFGDMRAGGGDGGHHMAVVQDLVPGDTVQRQMLRVDRQLSHGRHARPDLREVLGP